MQKSLNLMDAINSRFSDYDYDYTKSVTIVTGPKPGIHVIFYIMKMNLWDPSVHTCIYDYTYIMRGSLLSSFIS